MAVAHCASLEVSVRSPYVRRLMLTHLATVLPRVNEIGRLQANLASGRVYVPDCYAFFVPLKCEDDESSFSRMGLPILHALRKCTVRGSPMRVRYSAESPWDY